MKRDGDFHFERGIERGGSLLALNSSLEKQGGSSSPQKTGGGLFTHQSKLFPNERLYSSKIIPRDRSGSSSQEVSRSKNEDDGEGEHHMIERADSSDSGAFLSEDEEQKACDVNRSKSNKSLKKYRSNLVKEAHLINYGNHQTANPLEQGSIFFRKELGGIVVYDSYARYKGGPVWEPSQEELDFMPQSEVDESFMDYVHSLPLYKGSSVEKDGSKLLRNFIRSDPFNELEPKASDFSGEADKNLYESLPAFTALPEYYSPENQHTLVVPKDPGALYFSARFEHGNLSRAIKVNEREYNLVLHNDVNTKGHT